MPIKTFGFRESPSAADFNRYFMQQIFVRKTTTESVTSSIAPQWDNELFADVEANTDYFVTMIVVYDGNTAASAVGDLRSEFSGPAGSTFDYCSDSVWSGAATSVDQLSRTHQQMTNNPGGGTMGAGTSLGAPFKGILRVSTLAGLFRYSWAQNTSSTVATRVLAGSIMMLRRLTN